MVRQIVLKEVVSRAKTRTPPPPPLTATDLLGQLVTTLKSTPPPVSQPVVQQPHGIDPFFAQLVNELKRQQTPPQPPPLPESLAKELLQQLKALAWERAGAPSHYMKRQISKFRNSILQRSRQRLIKLLTKGSLLKHSRCQKLV